MVSFFTSYKERHLARNTKQLSEKNDLFISLVFLSYVLAFMEYWPYVAGKYASTFAQHFIINLRVLTIFYGCCVCGLSCDCGLNCETAIRRNPTAPSVETMCYFNRKILRSIKIRYSQFQSSNQLAFNYNDLLEHAHCGPEQQLLETSSSTAERLIKDHAEIRIMRPACRERTNVKILQTYI